MVLFVHIRRVLFLYHASLDIPTFHRVTLTLGVCIRKRMTRETYSVRLDEDDAARVEQFAEDRGISESEAIRRLIRAGDRARTLPLLGNLLS
jgi:hypothetical protein